MENKSFQIDANIVSNRKKTNKSTNKNSTNRKPSKKSNSFSDRYIMKSIIFTIHCDNVSISKK